VGEVVMTPAKDSNLQVRIDAELLAEFRQYAEGRGTTMSRVLLSWIRGAVGGSAPPRDSVVTCGDSRQDGRSDSRHDSGELVLLARRQVELLEQLVANRVSVSAGSAVAVEEVVITPMGGDGDDDFSGCVSRDEVVKREKVERGIEMWLQNIATGGDPVTPPGYEEMSEEGVREMGRKCLAAMGIDVVEEVLDQLLQSWVDG
jgi:hypothetical protein